MAEDNSENTSIEGLALFAEKQRERILEEDESDPIVLAERVYQLCLRWEYFILHIISPTFDTLETPIIIPPDKQFVYPIHDGGSWLGASKDPLSGTSMCKLHYTIEKIMYLLTEKLKQHGIDPQTEVQVAFDGGESAQRKGFEDVINSRWNIYVTNVDITTSTTSTDRPWGEYYLEIVKRIAEKGFGYPPESPRQYPLGEQGPTVKSS